ncbi:MAG: N-acetyltransferase [Candidatus Rhabdochlamydia sp.]
MSSSCHIRLFEEKDERHLIQWLSNRESLQWFPMISEWEIQDAVKIWKGYIRQKSAFTAEYDGKVAGMGVLYLQPFEKWAHQCCFALIVDKPYRNLGIGKALIEHFEKVGKETFSLKFLHLEVYDHNPAIHLYRKMGFIEFGRHPQFIKENGIYKDKILMQKTLR